MLPAVYELGFLVLRFLLESLDRFLHRLKWKKTPCHNEFKVELLRIFARNKTDFSDDEDFICFHESYQSAQILTAPQWFLSKITSKFAYFALLPEGKSIEDFQVEAAPFLWITLFEVSEKLARLPINEFCVFAEQCFGEPSGRLAFIHNPPRSGSTLLCKMIRVPDPNVIVLSEPEPLGMLGYRRSNGEREWPEQMSSRVTKAVVSSLCKNMHSDQIYIIKNFPHAVREVGAIRASFPNAKHVFVFRRDLMANIRSLLRVLCVTDSAPDRRLFQAISRRFPQIVDWLHKPGWYRSEIQYIKLVKPTNLLDMCAVVIGSVVHAYTELCRSQDVTIFYEDLLQNGRPTITKLFRYIGLSEQCVDISLKAKNQDSQLGTWLSSDHLKSIPIQDLTDSDLVRLGSIWKLMQADVHRVLSLHEDFSLAHNGLIK